MLLSPTRLASVIPLLLTASLAACDSDPASPDEDVDATTATDSTAQETDTSEPPPIDLSLRPEPGQVFAGVTEKAADLIGGPKAEGIVGDIKLWNNKAAFIIETLRPTGGYRQEGGNVIDVDFATGGADRFGEVWQAWNLLIFYPDDMQLVSDGRDGRAKVRFTGRTGIYTWANSFIVPILNPQPADLKITYEYSLAPDDNVLELVVTLENDTEELINVDLPLIAMNMGDGAANFGIGGGIGGVTGNSQPWIGMIGLERSYGFLGQGQTLNGLFNYQNVQLLQVDPYSLEPGRTIEQKYAFVVGDDGTTTIAETAATRYGVGTVGKVSGTVTGEVEWQEDEPPPSNTNGRSWVTAFQNGDVHGITPVADDGTFTFALAPGDYELRAYAPQRGASGPVSVTVPASLAEQSGLALSLPALGEVVVTVVDGADQPLPVEITFFRNEAPAPFSPELAGFDRDWGRGRSAVVFSPDGLGRAHLLPGTYTVTAARGWSYEIDQAEVTVAPGTTQNVNLSITKVVDDSGWIAADAHLHSIWSPDSDSPYIARMRQAAANDIMLPIFSEHVNIGHPMAELDAAKVGDWIIPVPAQEVTTFEYGHFNAYPMEYRPDEPSFGAVFEHGHEGAALFDAIRDQHEHPHLTQINHPRGSAKPGAYFSYVELDRATASSTNPRWSTNWDVIEVFNGSCSRGGDNGETLQDWFAMNDHGLGKVLGSGSDSHSEAAGLGHPRQWIQTTRAAVEADLYAMVAPMRNRKTFVSCGPFVTFTTSDGKGMGELAGLIGGSATFNVKVQAPSWIELASVRLLENGVPVPGQEADLTGNTSVVRFDGTFTVTPADDAWYVIEVIGAGNLWPTDPGDEPYAMTNPIEIDADGDAAWTPPAVTGSAPARAQAPRLPDASGAERFDPTCKHDH